MPDPTQQRDDRPDADAEEVASTIVITDPEGNPLLIGALVQEDSIPEAEPGPDFEVTATGEDYTPPDGSK